MTPGEAHSDASVKSAPAAGQRTRIRARSSVLSAGEPMIWLTGGSMMLCLAMVILLLVYIFGQGMMTFWPVEVTHLVTDDGRRVMGEVTRRETYDFTAGKAWSDWVELEQRIASASDDLQAEELRARRDQLMAKAVELLIPTVEPALEELDHDGAADAFRNASLAIDALGQSLSNLDLPLDARPQQVRDNLGKLHDLQSLLAQTPDQVDLLVAIERLTLAENHLRAIRKSVELMFYIGGDRDFAQVRRSQKAVQQLDERLDAVRQVLEDRLARPKVRKAVRENPERFLHTLAELVQSKEPGVAHTAQVVRDLVRVEHQRRLVRTGNYRISKTHFDWVADYQIAESSLPPWAVVVERREWGRFYGFPKSFTLNKTRPVSEEERQLDAIKMFLTVHGRKLGDDGGEALKAVIQQVQQKLSAIRARQSQAFLAEYNAETDPATQWLAVLEGEQAVAADRVAADHNVIAMRQVTRGEVEAWAQFRKHHQTVLELFQREYKLRKSDIGDVNHDQEQSRLAIRQLELDTKTSLLEIARQVLSLNDQLDALGRQIEQASQAPGFAEQHFGGDSPVTRLTTTLFERFNESMAKRRSELAGQINELKLKLGERLGDQADRGMLVLQDFWDTQHRTAEKTRQINEQITALDKQQARYEIELQAIGNGPNRDQAIDKSLALADIVRAYPANRLDRGDKWGIYLARWGEFLTDDPREANTEGGVFPAIVGTVIMTLILAIVVVPFGALAALYLREYAKAGPIVSTIRIAINNLAGVPSIVFGVFGLVFFCYIVGGFIDGGAKGAGLPVLPRAWWFGLLIGAAAAELLGIAAAYANRGGGKREGNATPAAINLMLGGPLLAIWAAVAAGLLWWTVLADSTIGVIVRMLVLGAVIVFFWMLFSSTFREKNDPRSTFSRTVYLLGLATAIVAALGALGLVATTPFFDGFYQARLADGNPTFGKSALVWASLTLALLTLPVVIVATEEALAAVPNSMREGSYACGASKWQTIKRIVLPRAMPGIMTGMILAMARGAGEVAPLMLVGAVKLAPKLPISSHPPFGIDRSFMHLGFHIYDVGFQSPNSEAAKPMVFTTTFLLIVIVALLNIAAIALRTRLRRKFVANQF